MQIGLTPVGHLLGACAITLTAGRERIVFSGDLGRSDDLLLPAPQAIATGNIGCITQLATGLQVPILHTVELLDWVYGGPKPDKIKSLKGGA